MGKGLKHVLHNPRESEVVQIGAGLKVSFGRPWPRYGQQKQRSGLTEAALSQAAGSCAGHL
jgi:hypothetical protein